MHKTKILSLLISFSLVLLLFSSGCMESSDENNDEENIVERTDKIPDDAVKYTPENDVFKPVLHSDLWEEPVPIDNEINTAGAEDSPFITPDGNEFYFFFTPDVDVPAQDQLIDGVTGIWYSERTASGWSEPERIKLGSDESLDGTVYIKNDKMWFASVRSDNYGEVDIYTAEKVDGKWKNIENAGELLNEEYDIGELHISDNGETIYFGRDGDIYRTEKTSKGWSEPNPLSINTEEYSEGQPFITSDGQELWFTGQSRKGHTGPSVFRSIWNGSGWGEPTEIISNFAGEPCLDGDGNIYFVHHFYDQDMNMLEADIYVAYRK